MSIKSSRDKKYWIDTETDNKWSKDTYTKAEAIELSKTLVMCSYCTDCVDCSCCMSCEACTDCHYCTDCSRCKNCCFSSRCMSCTDSRNCCWCESCTDCSCCRNSRYCEYSSQCDSCVNCSGTVRVAGVTNADAATGMYSIVGPVMGSRKATPIVQYDDKGNINVIVGCFQGTLNKLRYKVKSTYPNKKAKHRRRYMAFIKAVRAFVSAVTDPDPDIED